MAKKLVIFGTGDIAQLAQYYFRHDSEYEVVAFTVDRPYLKATEFCGLPVVAFEDLVDVYPPSDYSLFVAVSYAKLNAVRKQKFEAAQALGYNLASYISSKATVMNEHAVGRNCFILEDNTIQPFCNIGHNVTLWSGNHIGHHSHVGNHAFVSSHVVISGGVRIGEQCFIGVNATVRDHISIGDRCVIGAGALILSDAEPDGVYVSSETGRSRVPSSRLRGI